MKKCMLALTVAALTAMATPAMAELQTGPLTQDFYITVDGLDWAWAGPVTSQDWGGANTLYQAELHEGWREATNIEWAYRPRAEAFAGKCAATYWNSSFTWCDFNDTVSQHWLAGDTYDSTDLLYVRGVSPYAAMPEPASLALVGVAVAGMTGVSRRRKKSSA